METSRRIRRITNYTLLTITFLIICIFFSGYTHAEEASSDQSGDDWSFSADGEMTIKSNQGWANCLKDGFEGNPWKLIIGKDVTSFRMYSLPDDLPTEDFFGPEDIIGRGRYGNIYYDYIIFWGLFPSVIAVEEGNPVFRVVDGMLINTETKELVLSEMGVTDVVVPEGIRTITRRAFYRRNLTSIEFPESLQEINEYAFTKCESLRSVDLPESVIQLKQGAFYECKSLQEVSLSSNLSAIEDDMFGYCAFQYIEIPKKVTEIGENAFRECDNLKQVVLPDGLERIGAGAFGSCGQLSNINLPEGLESIGRGAFNFCNNLKVMILPDSLQQIGMNVFAGCKLYVLRVPEKLDFTVFYYDRGYIVNPHKKTDKSFDLSYVNTVILSGSDYDFGYPAISNAKNVYFLGLPPEDVGRILDEETVKSIYCSDEFEFEWTRSTVASWVRQRLTILPADQINAWAETTINTTPKPTNTPRPTRTPRPTPTPWPTPMPRPSVSPVATVEPEKQAVDPILFVFAGVIALVVAGIVIMAVKNRKPKNRTNQKNK